MKTPKRENIPEEDKRPYFRLRYFDILGSEDESEYKALVKAIAEIVEPDKFDRVEGAIIAYAIKKQMYGGRSSVPIKSEKIGEIRKRISALTQLLIEPGTDQYLLGIAEKCFHDVGGIQIIAKPIAAINKNPRLLALDALGMLDKVCEAAINMHPLKPGRPKELKNAIHVLLDELYDCCKFANGDHLTTKPGNLLELLVKVLNKPLGLGGDLSGLVIDTIKKKVEKLKKPE